MRLHRDSHVDPCCQRLRSAAVWRASRAVVRARARVQVVCAMWRHPEWQRWQGVGARKSYCGGVEVCGDGLPRKRRFVLPVAAGTARIPVRPVQKPNAGVFALPARGRCRVL